MIGKTLLHILGTIRLERDVVEQAWSVPDTDELFRATEKSQENSESFSLI